MQSSGQRLLNRKEWLDWLENCPSATFYHTPYWYECWQQLYGHRIEANLADIDGTEVFYARAIKRKFFGLLDHTLSAPAGTYGGFLSRNELSPKAMEALATHFKNTTLGLIVYCPLQPMETPPSGMTDFTQMIRLDRNFETLLSDWSKGHLSAAKKGIREGVVVRKAVAVKDWYDYFDIYTKQLARWGEKASSRYSRAFFEYLSVLPPEVCQLWLAEYEGNIISGSVVFYFNQHVSYWHGAGSEDHLPLKGAHVLQYHILKDAVEKQYEWYDMNPSGGHEGVRHFKAGFGSREIPVITESFTGTRHKLLQQLLIKSGYA